MDVPACTPPRHCLFFARTSGKDGDARGITASSCPGEAPGVKIEEYLWTFNMPTDHPRVSFTDVWVPDDRVWGEVGGGLAIGQSFVHQNRIRQAASSLGAAVYCINESVKYARLSASPSARRWPTIRRSSGRWWSSRRRPRCCAC